MAQDNEHRASRREFLSTSGRIAAASALGMMAVPAVHAAERNTLKVALVGCGGRGTGAALNALSTTGGPTELVAMADVFEHRITHSLERLSQRLDRAVDVPEERRFVGFDAYQKAIDSLDGSGVVLLATPPGFRPLHLSYAVDRNCHVFLEKAHAVDGPGVRQVLEAGREASRKNLKVAGGLMSRHYAPLIAAVRQIHEGLIGEVITCWAYRAHGPVGFRPKEPNMTEMVHQVRNFHNFNWVGGSFILDWLIHNIDICCWIKNDWPISAQGQGGRQVRTVPDPMFDHYAVEYTFADGTRMFAQGRHMPDCWGFWGVVAQGAKGTAVLGEGIPDPLIYKGHKQTDENVIWRYEPEKNDPYQAEMDRLFEAIRADRPYSETESAAHASMAGILGRMAAESGQEVTWEQAIGSDLVLAPGLENYTYDSVPPVTPDEQDRYPIAMPGVTKAF